MHSEIVFYILTLHHFLLVLIIFYKLWSLIDGEKNHGKGNISERWIRS